MCEFIHFTYQLTKNLAIWKHHGQIMFVQWHTGNTATRITSKIVIVICFKGETWNLVTGKSDGSGHNERMADSLPFRWNVAGTLDNWNFLSNSSSIVEFSMRTDQLERPHPRPIVQTIGRAYSFRYGTWAQDRTIWPGRKRFCMAQYLRNGQ